MEPVWDCKLGLPAFVKDFYIVRSLNSGVSLKSMFYSNLDVIVDGILLTLGLFVSDIIV